MNHEEREKNKSKIYLLLFQCTFIVPDVQNQFFKFFFNL
jgi:hypothetical protein